MAGKRVKTHPEFRIGDNDVALTVPSDVLLSMSAGEQCDNPDRAYTKDMVKIVDRRVKEIYLAQADGTPVKFSALLTISREPLTDEERAAVDETAKNQKENKAEREANEQEKREREISAACARTTEQLFTTLGNIDKAQRAAAAFGTTAAGRK